MTATWANPIDRLAPDDGDDLAPWDREVLTSSGETVELPPVIARKRRAILDNRETDRIRYCAKHGLDPATFGRRPHECHGCGGTGWNWRNDLPCWCEGGKSALRTIQRRMDDETARLAELVLSERRAK